LLRALLPADALPKRRPVIKIVRDNDTVLPRGLDRFNNQPRRRLAQSGKDSARVKPARADFAEDLVPIEIPLHDLAGRRVSPIGNAYRAANAETSFGEVESIPNCPPHFIVRHPFDELGIDSA